MKPYNSSIYQLVCKEILNYVFEYDINDILEDINQHVFFNSIIKYTLAIIVLPPIRMKLIFADFQFSCLPFNLIKLNSVFKAI